MAEFPAMPLWTDARATREMLVEDGWLSPDTYCTFYAEIPSGPAVYLLAQHNSDFYKVFIAYVGMSTDLSMRMAGHEVLAKLRRPGYWPMRWFKPVASKDLRRVEGQYIAKFDPPWNIIGRRRGVCLQ